MKSDLLSDLKYFPYLSITSDKILAQNASINLTQLNILLSIHILFGTRKFAPKQIFRFSTVSRQNTYTYLRALYVMGYISRIGVRKSVKDSYRYYLSPKGLELVESFLKELQSYFYTYKGGRLRRPRKGKVKQSLYDIVREVRGDS